MQPQLHATVSAVATPEGLLLRMGEAFLPIDGRGMASSFRRLAPFLDGRWSVRALTQAAPKAQRRGLVRLLKALRDAGMTFDAARAPATAATVAQAVPAPHLIVFGPTVLAHAVLEPLCALQPGRLAVACSDSDGAVIEAQHLDGHLDGHRDGHAVGAAGTAVDHAACSVDEAELAAFDIVVLLGHAPADRAWMEDVERACALAAQVSGGETPAIVPLVLQAGHVLVGPVVRADDVRRVRDLLGESRLERQPAQLTGEMRPDAASAAAPLLVSDPAPLSSIATIVSSAPAIAIAANLLARKIAEAHAGRVPAEERHLLHDVDVATLEIRPRPMPLPACAPLRGLRTSGAAASATARGVRTRRRGRSSEADDWHLLDRLNRLLVDPVTGLLSRLEEEELGQIPHHQSSALWRPPHAETPVRTTDAGGTILESRVAVARLVLEEYLRDACARDADLSAQAIVASSVDEATVRAEAWFKALASAAEARGDWSEIAVDVATQARDGEAALTFGYLADIGEADAIQLARCVSLATDARAELLRFSLRGRPISIVAGPPGDACWTIGLRDIWLDVTARRAFGDTVAPWPRLRRRSAFAASGLGAREIVPALPWRCEPIVWPERDHLDPLRFAVASIVD